RLCVFVADALDARIRDSAPSQQCPHSGESCPGLHYWGSPAFRMQHSLQSHTVVRSTAQEIRWQVLPAKAQQTERALFGSQYPFPLDLWPRRLLFQELLLRVSFQLLSAFRLPFRVLCVHSLTRAPETMDRS